MVTLPFHSPRSDASVSATILEWGARPVCEWLIYKNADSCNSGLQCSSNSQVLCVPLASHNQLRDSLLVVEMWLY